MTCRRLVVVTWSQIFHLRDIFSPFSFQEPPSWKVPCSQSYGRHAAERTDGMMQTFITGLAPSALSWVTVQCNLSLAFLKRSNLEGKSPWPLMPLLPCLLPILTTAQSSSYMEVIICRVPGTVGSEGLLQYNDRVIMINFAVG